MNTVVSQGLATGLPVLVTAHSGLPEQVLDGRNGAVAPEADPAALAARLVWLVEQADRWPEFSRFGRAHVLAHYDEKKLIDDQVRDYRSLSGRT